MNVSSILGVILGTSIMYLSIKHSGMDMKFFLNFHGIVIVMGGTLAAACLSFPLMRIISLVRIFVSRVLGGRRINYPKMVEEIIEINRKLTLNLSPLPEIVANIKHPFLKEAVGLAGSGVLTARELRDVLEARVKTIEEEHLRQANMFRIIGRYPPAFGLLATTLGMISLLHQIGKPGSEQMIGPAMSIGLVGTLYGIALANLVFLPIGERLAMMTEEEVTLRKIIVEGALLIRTQVNPLTLRENLNSYLSPGKRITGRQNSAA